MGDILKGKVAIVIGGGSVPGPPDIDLVGNGKACAITYAREGASVMVVDLNRKAAEETCRLVSNHGGSCSVFEADISKAKDCQALAGNCLDLYGRIDILHNNVGIVKFGKLLEATEEDWDRTMNVNVKGMFLASRAVIPHMMKQGGGSIVNISSVGAVLPKFPEEFMYLVSKAAVNMLTRTMAFEFAGKGIRVNAIMPGMMDTPLIYEEIMKLYDGDVEAMRKDRNKRVPIGRMGESWDIADAALFLVSDKAKYITGQILTVDGGLVLTGG
jgi:NAD(P)-dependent dehydrogenase (short-subunit alcohol dehydrogenase family)